MLIAFFMSGWYTPVFRGMYELLPGVKLFRRPADATFVFGAMIAFMAGYAVHRWLTDAPATMKQRRIVFAIFALILIGTAWLASTTIRNVPWGLIGTGLAFLIVARLALWLAAASRHRRAGLGRDAAGVVQHRRSRHQQRAA